MARLTGDDSEPVLSSRPSPGPGSGLDVSPGLDASAWE